MDIRLFLVSFAATAVVACSSTENSKPPTTPAGEGGKSKLTQASCTERLQKHGELCAEDDKAKEANKNMSGELCPKVEKEAELAAWLECLTDIKAKEECGEQAAKCQPIYDAAHKK
jgi:hypothetical protein